MNIDAYLVNWDQVYDNVCDLEQRLTACGIKPTVINSGSAVESQWTHVGDIRYFRQLYTALKMFDRQHTHFMFCAGDLKHGDWPSLFDRARLIMSDSQVGVYAPMFTYTPWGAAQTHVCAYPKVDGAVISTQTDGMFVIMARNVADELLKFYEYAEQHINWSDYRTGWGIDIVWSSLCMCLNQYIIRDSLHYVEHPEGSSYDHSRAWEEMNNLIDLFKRHGRTRFNEDCAATYCDAIFKHKDGKLGLTDLHSVFYPCLRG